MKHIARGLLCFFPYIFLSSNKFGIDITTTGSLQIFDPAVVEGLSSRSALSPIEISIKPEFFKFKSNFSVYPSWNLGVRGRYNIGEEDNENFAIEAGLQWFYSKCDFDFSNQINTIISVKRQGLELSPALRFYAIRSKIFSMYIKVGTAIQYAILRSVKYENNQNSTIDYAELEQNDEDKIRKLGVSLVCGLGISLYKDILDIGLFSNIWLNNIIDDEYNGQKAAPVFCEIIEINPLVGFSLGIAVDLLPLFEKKKEEDGGNEEEEVFLIHKQK